MMRILFFALMLVPVSVLGMPSEITVQHVRIVLERGGDHIETTQFIRLVGSEKGNKENKYIIPLPAGATGTRYREEENSGITTHGNSIVVQGVVPPQGRSFSYAFDMPIENESMVLEQTFGSPVLSAQVISMWTDSVKLSGTGFSAAEWGEASSGLQALMIANHQIENRTISIRLDGLSSSSMETWKMGTFLLSVAFLCLGFAIWLRRRIEFEEESDHLRENNHR